MKYYVLNICILLGICAQILNAQEDLTESKIDSIYEATIKALPEYKKEVVYVEHENYDWDSIVFCFDNKDLRYIMKYTKYNMSEFPMDRWTWEEYLRMDDKLIMNRYKSKSVTYGEIPNKVSLSDFKVYFNLKGEAIQYYDPIGASGTKETVDSLLQLETWKTSVPPNELKYYNSDSKKDIAVIELLVKEYPRYNYLLE